jgi:CRP-like cAMP-binding protein
MHTFDKLDRNQLLASLLEAGCEGLRSHLELVPMTYGDVLYEAGSKLVHAYFPTNSVVSLLSVMEDGASDEIAFVGCEGIVGVPLFLGAERSPYRVVVRGAGHAFRLNGQLLLEEFSRSGAMQNLLLRYTDALLTQISQTVACNRHHSIQQQFCRWLLSSIDRLPSDELCLTQESIAGMLGVRRETITKEVGELQAAGLIQNGRGRIVVIDRPKLEALACECYRGMKSEFGRLTGTTSTFFRHPKRRTPGRYLPEPGTAARARIAAVVAAPKVRSFTAPNITEPAATI